MLRALVIDITVTNQIHVSWLAPNVLERINLQCYFHDYIEGQAGGEVVERKDPVSSIGTQLVTEYLDAVDDVRYVLIQARCAESWVEP